MATIDSQMPMGQSAARLSLNPQELPPLPILPTPSPSPAAIPAPGSAPAAAAPPPPATPVAAPSAEPPWKVKLQTDGSSVFYIPGPSGTGVDDIIIGVNPPPKLPKAFQPPAQQPQSGAGQPVV